MPKLIEVSAGSRPDSFQISATRISGGDLRGLMYGLLEAAAQIRAKGRLAPLTSEPEVALRSVRVVLRNEEWEKRSFHDPQYWTRFVCTLARVRLNRLQLVFGSEDRFWSPLFPRLFSLPLFPAEEAEGMTTPERERNVAALKMIAQAASGCGVDFSIGMDSGVHVPVTGIAVERHSAYIRAAFERLLVEIPSIRAVQVKAARDLLRDVYLPAIHEAGRLVTLEVLETDADELRKEAREHGVALRLVQPLGKGMFLPPVTQLRASREPVLRAIPTSRFVDPAFAALAARGVALGAQGIEVEGSGAFDTAQAEVFYETWGKLLFDPSQRVEAVTPLREASFAAGRAETVRGWAAAQTAADLETVQSLHGSALEVEPALEALPKESELRAELEREARTNRYEARKMWADVMEAYYAKTNHASALLAARNEVRGALRVGEMLKANVEPLQRRLTALEEKISKLAAEEGSAAMPWQAPTRKPTIMHRPFQMVLNDKPLIVPLHIGQIAGLTRIRLRYRMLSAEGDFKMLESAPRTPVFTIPQADLRVEGTLIYYFEIEHVAGKWLEPDPRFAVPVFTTTIKSPPPVKEERARLQ